MDINRYHSSSQNKPIQTKPIQPKGNTSWQARKSWHEPSDLTKRSLRPQESWKAYGEPSSTLRLNLTGRPISARSLSSGAMELNSTTSPVNWMSLRQWLPRPSWLQQLYMQPLQPCRRPTSAWIRSQRSSQRSSPCPTTQTIRSTISSARRTLFSRTMSVVNKCSAQR